MEGWALDVEDVQGVRLIERLANDTRLWVICLVIVVAAAIALALQAGSSYSRAPVATVQLGQAAKGTHTDAEHLKLVDDLTKIARKRGVQLTAWFDDVTHFSIIVPSDTSADEISYLSRFAATAIYRRFGNVAIIYVHTKSNVGSDETPKLTAITRWSEREKSFLTRFQRSMAAE